MTPKTHTYAWLLPSVGITQIRYGRRCIFLSACHTGSRAYYFSYIPNKNSTDQMACQFDIAVHMLRKQKRILPMLRIPFRVSSMVTNSAQGNASQTPGMPNRDESRNAKIRIATKPRDMDEINAHCTDSTALRMLVPTMLIPANKNPVKYRRSPCLASAASSRSCSRLKIPAIGSAQIWMRISTITAVQSAVFKASPITI